MADVQDADVFVQGEPEEQVMDPGKGPGMSCYDVTGPESCCLAVASLSWLPSSKSYVPALGVFFYAIHMDQSALGE